MQTLEQMAGADDSSGAVVDDPMGAPAGTTRRRIQIALSILLAAGLVYWCFVEPKIFTTVLTVVVAVGLTAAIWIAANILFDQVRNRWVRFSVLAFGGLGALYGIVLHGNQITVGSGRGFFTWVIGPLAGALAFGVLAGALAITDDAVRRRAIALGGSLAIGVGTALVVRSAYQPELDVVATIAYTAVGIVVGVGLSLLRKRPLVGGALTGAAIGWIVGAWGGADLGAGNLVTTLIACIVPAVLIGVRLGMSHNPDYQARVQIDETSRAVIFVGPAVLFILVMLVIPAIRTFYLSLYDDDSVEFVGADNYKAVFTNEKSFDATNWTNMFTSFPFIIGVILLAIAAVVAIVMKKQTGRALELGNATGAPLVVGVLLVCFGVFTALRGTLINNLWWVVTVTFLATALGLAVAVLADNRGGERAAKSLIFMPMAISLVGASVIWRFVYAARDTNSEQTGFLNSVWIAIGKLSTGSGLPTFIATGVIFLLLMLAMAFLAKALVARRWSAAVMPGVMTILLGWLFIRFAGIIGDGMGGFKITPEGEVVPSTVLFVQESPYNNFWLMIILIWIQVGFSMVILSAAIKAVPTELIEAAKIDGATDSQVFWRVTLPQIGTTIAVVVTTTVVLVMKVFDIVKVVTNGNFGTQVLANNMYAEAFTNANKGLGAALAMIIFFSVLPVMYYNIRKMRREG
jgi:alpha-glucoside transport system permease protein